MSQMRSFIRNRQIVPTHIIIAMVMSHSVKFFRGISVRKRQKVVQLRCEFMARIKLLLTSLRTSNRVVLLVDFTISIVRK